MKGPCKENGRNMKSNGRNVTGKMNVTWTDLLCASLKCFVWIYCGQTPTPTNSLHNSILGAFCLRWVVSDIFEPTWNALNLSFFLRFLDVREGFVRCFWGVWFFSCHTTHLPKCRLRILWGFPMRCWFFRDCFSFCLGCFDCWLVTLRLSVSFGWFFEIYVLCHTLRFCFYFLRLFANVFEIFESVWDFLEGIFSQTPMLQNASKWSCWNFWRSYFQGQYLEIYINMYPNIWARVDFLKICSKFFLISVCILQINLCNPPQP